jgi:hypothetical protein
MQHLDEGTIHAWLDGALPPEQVADVERHARTCTECAALVADARGVIAGAARIVSALDDVPGGVIPARQPKTLTRSLWRTLRLTPFRAAIAASLLVAVASMLVVRNAPEKKAADTATVAAAMPAIASPASTPPAANAQVAKEAHQAPPAGPRVGAVANAAPKTSAPVLAPAAAPPAAREQYKILSEQRKALAEVKDQKAVADSMSSRPPEAKTRAAELTSAAMNSRAPASGAPVPAAAPAANAERGAATRREVSDRQTVSLIAVSADDHPIQAPGCFQLVRDSVKRLPQIPERFSLELVDESGDHRNIVRAVNLAGRRDSVVTGITWTLLPGSTRLVFSNSESFAPATDFRSEAIARSSLGARKAAVGNMTQGTAALARISRLDCR